MNDEHATSKADSGDDRREDTLRGMLSEFYSRPMRSVAILVWVCALLFMAVAVVSAVQFFKADQIKDQIMYAAIFLCVLNWVSLLKIFAWQTLHKNSIKRAIERLEARLAEVGSA